MKQTAIILLLSTTCAFGQWSGTYTANDTLSIAPGQSADEQAMLDELAWTPRAFEVRCEPGDGRFDAMVTFPSPHPSGNATNDRVVMEWYAALGDDGKPIDAPGMIVLHILDGRMAVARLIARTFSFNGIHAFVMHQAYYGQRRPEGYEEPADQILSRLRQSATDARRARDAAAVLPHVVRDRIGIQGTSLGGFVTSIAASIDGGFDPVFIVLGGADIHGMLLNAKRDSASVRRELEAAGYTGDKLRDLAWAAEPSRLAHRLDPRRTWLFSATDDRVVPAANARVLAAAANLDEQHHQWFTADHYTAAVYLPDLCTRMVRIIHAAAPPVHAD
jgi:dienelactone hydrolase